MDGTIQRIRIRYGERRFAALLLTLVGLLVGPPLLHGFSLSPGWFDTLFSLVMLAMILSFCYERQRRIALLLGVPTIVLSLGGHALAGPPKDWAVLAGHWWGVVFLLSAAGFIVKTLLRHRSVTADSIYGAVCGYLLLGVGWGLLYSLIELYWPGSFAVSEALRRSSEADYRQTNVLLYYSFVTLTTVGYGDVTPVSAPARTFAWIEAITGQFYLAVIVAGLVSILVTKAMQAKPPE